MMVRGQQKSVTINITYQITTRVQPDYIKSRLSLGAYQRPTTKKVAVKIQEFPSTEREKMEVREKEKVGKGQEKGERVGL